MSQELATRPINVPAELQEKVLIGGDLSKLSVPERLSYYKAVCESVGLNPLTRPFEYLILNDRMVLYARKDCTDQLRDLHGISVEIASREVIDGVCVVTARAKNMTERIDESVGAVPFMKENGEWKKSESGKPYFKTDGTYTALALADRANAMMKAETKAKRRVTLSICGLGMFDETELDTLPNVKRAMEDPDKKHTLSEMYALTHEVEEGVSPVAGVSEGEADPPSNRTASPAPSVFDESSAILDHQTALDECKTDDELKQAWTDCTKDARLTSETRKPLYDRMMKRQREMRGRK